MYANDSIGILTIVWFPESEFCSLRVKFPESEFCSLRVKFPESEFCSLGVKFPENEFLFTQSKVSCE